MMRSRRSTPSLRHRTPLEPDHLTARAGAAIETLSYCLDALAAADRQHDANIGALATYKAAAANLKVETNVHDADYVSVVRERSASLVNADLSLRTTVETVNRVLPALQAACARRVHGCAIAARRILVADLTRRLAYANTIVNLVRAQQQTQAKLEAPLLALVERMRQITGQPLVIPDLLWPVGGDPFQPPSLA
jgi:hypothetical protein